MSILVLTGISTAVSATEFVMKNGSTLDGEISRSSLNTATITLKNGMNLMVGFQDIETVKMTVDDGSEVEGILESWRDGVYGIRDGDRLLSIQEGIVVAVAEGSPDAQQDVAALPEAATQPEVAPNAGGPETEIRQAARSPETTGLSRDEGRGDGFYLATDRPEDASYSAGVGISTLVKMMLLPQSGIDLQIVSTSQTQEKIDLLTQNWAEFGLVSTFPENASYDDLRSIATLWSEDEEITELVARHDVDEDTVYAITEVIFDNLPFLERISPVFSKTSLDKALVNLELPLHPGAKRYYDERILSPTNTNGG